MYAGPSTLQYTSTTVDSVPLAHYKLRATSVHNAYTSITPLGFLCQMLKGEIPSELLFFRTRIMRLL